MIADFRSPPSESLAGFSFFDFGSCWPRRGHLSDLDARYLRREADHFIFGRLRWRSCACAPLAERIGTARVPAAMRRRCGADAAQMLGSVPMLPGCRLSQQFDEEVGMGQMGGDGRGALGEHLGAAGAHSTSRSPRGASPWCTGRYAGVRPSWPFACSSSANPGAETKAAPL